MQNATCKSSPRWKEQLFLFIYSYGPYCQSSLENWKNKLNKIKFYSKRVGKIFFFGWALKRVWALVKNSNHWHSDNWQVCVLFFISLSFSRITVSQVVLRIGPLLGLCVPTIATCTLLRHSHHRPIKKLDKVVRVTLWVCHVDTLVKELVVNQRCTEILKSLTTSQQTENWECFTNYKNGLLQPPK